MPLASVLALLLAPAWAQTPDDRWHTIETETYRVHYPEQAEPWALEAAAQLDDIRRRVAEQVGYVPPQVVDVVVVDPYTMANGSAWPFLGSPRLLLWATPPESSSVIGNYRSWTELLLTHEDAHLVHMLRPSRNPLSRWVDGLVGMGPVTRKAPRWVTEGYATVIEARLTGYGRPHADFRAQLLRELAREGRMPAYGELDAFERFQGGGFAYLVGSAYLEWLEARGPGKLPDLWARMSAKKTRKFPAAFEGVFGDDPETLYSRFVAELTHQALEIEAARPVEPGTLFLDLERDTGPLTVSPDGSKLAAVVDIADHPPALVVWSTEVDRDAAEERAEKVTELLEEDPADVPAIDPKVPPREELARRNHATRSPVAPRWMPDGESLLFTAWSFDEDRRYRPDLWTWDPETGHEERVTRWQDVRLGDPAPDGTWASAVQHDWGRTRIVKVDLSTGAVEPVTAFDIAVVVDEPRVSPDGARLAWLEHRGGGWEIVVRELASGADEHVRRGGEGGPTFSNLAWGPTSRQLYASVGRGGFVEVEEVLDLDGGLEPITRTAGGAFGATASSDEWLYYLSMDAKGFEVHRTPLSALEEAPPVVATSPAVRPPTPDPVSLPVRAEGLEPKRYGAGRTEFRPLVGVNLSESQGAVEVGLRAGDIVGKRDLLLIGSYGHDAGITGGRLAVASRALPVRVMGEGFVAIEGAELLERAGGAASLATDLGRGAWAGELSAGGWVDVPLRERLERGDPLMDVPIPPEAVIRVTPERQVGWARLALRVAEPRSQAFAIGLEGRGQFGLTGGESWVRADGRANLSLGRKYTLDASYARGFTTATWGLDQYRLGGVPSSVLPEAWMWSRVLSPGFAVGELRGATRDEVSVRFPGNAPVHAFGERHRMGEPSVAGGGASADAPALGSVGATLVGVQTRLSTAAQPFGKLPAVTTHAGVGCALEDPLDGWDATPCDTLGAWTGWATVTWGL